MEKAANNESIITMNHSEYRYERKFFVTNSTTDEVTKSILFNPALFQEIYHERDINNIYFDTPDYNNYKDNVDGRDNRIKVRLRWYGALKGTMEKTTLEIKIKQGLVGKKISIPSGEFELNTIEDTYSILKILASKIEVPGIDLAGLIPTVINRYTRRYYISDDQKYRVTIDENQSFFDTHLKSNSIENGINDKNSHIIEVKYNPENNCYVNSITNHFPFRLSKSSKYVRGIDLLNNI